MSVNIKTASGLQKLSSNVTKNTIADALGYTPANPDSVNADLRTHTTDTNIHVSLAEKDKFLDYKQLNNLPNILDDESGEFSILDKNGNTALQVDSTGVTNVASLKVNGEDVATFMENTTAISNNHLTDQVRHITAEERTHWNDKAKLEGAIQIQDTGDTFTILDNVGNAALQVTEDGTTDVAKLSIKGNDVEKTISDAADAVAANLTTHITSTNESDGSIHIQPGERAKWNDTSKMEGNLQLQDEGHEFVISDNAGNVAFQVVGTGITQVADLEINGINTAEEIARVEGAASAKLQAHTSRTDNPHQVTKAQVGLGNADNTSDADKPISTAQAAKNEALDKRIDDAEAALQTHKTTTVSDGAIHIQENDRTRWDDKSWHSLTDKPNIVNNDQSTEFQIVDSKGNVAVQVDADGVTNVAKLSIQGVDVDTTLDGIDAEFTNIKNGTTIVKHAELADLATGANKLKSSRTISLSGDATGSVAFDGSQDVTLDVTVADNSHNHQIGITTEDDEVVNIEGTSQENAIKLKAYHGESGVTPSTYTKVTVNKYGHVTGGENPTTLSGYGITDAALQGDLDELIAEVNNIKTGDEDVVVKNAEHADYADVWTTKRKITLDGDASGSVEVDGSKDVTLTVAVKDDSHTHLINPTAQTNSEGPLTFTSDSGNCAVTYTVNHKTSTVTAGTYTSVTVDEYGHITSGETPDASWSSIVGRPDITPAPDGNDTEILVKDSSDNVALQLDSTGVLNLAGATVNGIDVAVDYIDYTNDIAFDVTELVVS